MLAQVHQHIIGELNQSSRTDTVFMVTAVLFDLIVLGVNSALAASASSSHPEASADVVLGVFIAMSLLVNAIVILALCFGRSTRHKLLKGLLTMYSDNDVDRYYEASLLTNYGRRYMLFVGVIVCLAITGIVVPLVVRLM